MKYYSGSSFPDIFAERHAVFAEKLREMRMYDDPFLITSSSLGPEITIKGISKKVISFISLDYLGFGSCKQLTEFAAEKLKELGTGFASSRAAVESVYYHELETALADFKTAESCLLFNTGYLASSGLVSILLDDVMVGGKRLKKPKTLVFIDKLTHASIWDALLETKRKRGDKIEVRSFPHLDYDVLSSNLIETKNIEGDRFIITDSLFSMNGSVAKSASLLKLAREFGAIIVMDNAHSDGIYGNQGKGLLDTQGITNPADKKYFLEVGTFSKTFCSIGGYATLPASIYDMSRFSHWRYIFSVALPIYIVATCSLTLKKIQGKDGEARRTKLFQNIAFLKKALEEKGFNTLNSNTHIIPILIGDETICQDVQKFLVEKGLLVGAIRYPAVKKKGAILRISLTALHKEKHLSILVGGLVTAREKYKF